MAHGTIRPLVTRRNFLKGLGLFSASSALTACAQAGQSAQSSSSAAAAKPMLAIIHTNDTHGHDVEVKGSEDEKGNFSMAAVAALKAEWQQKGYEVVLVDAGDATQGTPLVDNSRGANAITFMNACGYDLMAVGNHDFDWGTEQLSQNEAAANFPLLSANIVDAETKAHRFATNLVKTLANGTKVGFFGLTTPSTVATTNPKNVADITFLRDDELYKCAEEQVKELRDQGCEIVVCVGHLGNETGSGGTSKDLLNKVKGIDLCIDGHDHEEVNEEVNGTLLVETGCYLHNIGVVAIDQGAPAGQLVAAGSFDKVDSAAQAIIDEENAKVEKELSEHIATTPVHLDGERAPGVRTQETNLGDLVADAFRWKASQELGREVDAGLSNGGGIRSSIEKGEITLKHVKTVMPFSNDLAVINVTGAQLLEAIEAGCQAVGKEKAIGAFPQVAGITYKLDASVPYEEGPTYPDSTYASPAKPGSRVTITDVAGRGFDANATYSVATVSFLCSGGDTYYAFKLASDAEKPVTFGFDYQALVDYLTGPCAGTVPEQYTQPQGRITVTGV